MNEWAERGGTPGDRQVIDMMLAHVPEGVSGSEGAYNRAGFPANCQRVDVALTAHQPTALSITQKAAILPIA